MKQPPNTCFSKILRVSNYLLTRYLDHFGRLGLICWCYYTQVQIQWCFIQGFGYFKDPWTMFRKLHQITIPRILIFFLVWCVKTYMNAWANFLWQRMINGFRIKMIEKLYNRVTFHFHDCGGKGIHMFFSFGWSRP